MNKLAPKTDTEYRIAYAQSWNLAVAMVAPERRASPLMKDVKHETQKILKHWQTFFYDQLVTKFEEELKKEQNKKEVRAKSELDFVQDLEDEDMPMFNLNENE